MRGLLFGLALMLFACVNPLGEHYEEKSDVEAKVRDTTEVRQEKLEEPTPYKRAGKCKQCHAAIVEEWNRSMHSKSTAAGDPLYALMKKKAAESMGAEKAEAACRQCHYADWSAREEKQGRDPVGVTCVVCHQIEPRHPKRKLASGKMAELAREHKGAKGVQGLCLSCHAEFRNQNDTPVCITGMEAEKAGQGKCVDCHMGIANGTPTAARLDLESHRSHDFIGAHNPRFLRGAARISLAKDGDEVVVTVKHGRVGHAVPTGNPMRFLVARVDQLDASGKVIASNVTTDKSPPLGVAPVFMRVFSDAAGHRPVPPFASKGQPIDTRLQPGDEKPLRVAVNAKAAKVRATLEFHLGPRKLLEEAGLKVEPAIMSQTELTLSP